MKRYPRGMDTALPATWDDLRVLLALHRNRSFLATGRALGISTSTAARRIEALERSLGRPLVQRSSAGTVIEPHALELVALAEQLELGLDAARRDEGVDRVEGTVRVSMGEGFIVPATRVLADLRRGHPGLRLELVAETRMADLARREADVAIRKVRSSSPVLVERHVGRLQFAFYATREFVERHLKAGRLRSADFARVDFIGFHGDLERTPQGQWLAQRSIARTVLRTNSDGAMLAAAEQGQGVALLATAVNPGPALVRLDCDLALPSVPIYLVFHRDLRKVPRVRLVIDTLEKALRPALA